jgi:glucose-6-phosphate 1-epimerase
MSTADVIKIDQGRGNLPRVTVTSELATAEIYLHGAHLTHFQPKGAQPVLFMSAKSQFEANKPIRGGVPVIFPWFGPRAGSPESPMHGFARIRPWQLESSEVQTDGSVRVVLGLESDESTLGVWQVAFGLRMSFQIGRSLEMELEVSHGGGEPWSFEEALHTYFRVGDAREIAISGLDGVEYIDKMDSLKRKRQPAGAIRITGETDRIYVDTRGTCTIQDPVLGRTIAVEKENSGSTVVWNPWIAKARAMADFGDEEWPGMVCIETANVGAGAIRLEPGQSHRLRTRITCQSGA